MKVIIINGSGGSGKDLFVKLVSNIYIDCINLSTVDKIKEIAKNNFGWKGEKTNKSRKFLSDIKRVWKEYNDGPFNDIINKIKTYEESNNNKDIIYFVHSREPKEIKNFVNYYKDKCVTLLIKRENIDIPNNDSDINVEKYNYDYIIKNNSSIEKLQKKALKFLKKIKKPQI
jgi:dephospho-CoA kinase